MAKIFINYRRDDSGGYAGRIYDHLEAHFGSDNLFMDTDNLLAGVDFESELHRSIKSSDVFLAIMGRSWTSVKDNAGRPRLSDPNDYVVLEIALALKMRHVLVLPLLLNGAHMPSPDELPAKISELTKRHAFELRDAGFRQSMLNLIERIERSRSEPLPIPTRPDAGTSESLREGIGPHESEGRETSASWTLPEELYLLCADWQTGDHPLGTDELTMAISGELALRNRISVEAGETMKLRDRTRTGDSILDKALDHLAGIISLGGNSTPSVWSLAGSSTFQTVQEKLRSIGKLERSERSNWIFFTSTYYTMRSASTQTAVRHRFAQAVESNATYPIEWQFWQA